jgi:hypothetical protein
VTNDVVPYEMSPPKRTERESSSLSMKCHCPSEAKGNPLAINALKYFIDGSPF